MELCKIHTALILESRYLPAQSCGDLLYGDFKEGTPGSLQKLAERLGAVILAGPATTSTPSAQPSVPTPPTQALLPGSIALVSQARGSYRAAGTRSSRSPAPQNSGATIATTLTPHHCKEEVLGALHPRKERLSQTR